MKTTTTDLSYLEGTTMKAFKSGMLSATVLALGLAGVAHAAEPRVTEPFRKEHVEVKEHLEHLEVMVGSLATAKPPAAKKTMGKVVGFLKDHILAHAAWEERVLYPAVDKRAAQGANTMTATMRWEHQIIGRWIEELEKISAGDKPDAVAFARRADNVLGLINAHFELEEEVLLPVLDKSMTAADYQQEIGSAHGK